MWLRLLSPYQKLQALYVAFLRVRGERGNKNCDFVVLVPFGPY